MGSNSLLNTHFWQTVTIFLREKCNDILFSDHDELQKLFFSCIPKNFTAYSKKNMHYMKYNDSFCFLAHQSCLPLSYNKKETTFNMSKNIFLIILFNF